MTRAPTVTIGMPVHDSNPEFFRLAIDSLLAQDFGDFEILLSDNHGKEEVVHLYEEAARRDKRVRWVRHETNIGMFPNFRYVAHEAKGKYFMWAADDDIRRPGFLASTVALLDAHPDCALASTRVSFIDQAGAFVGDVAFDPRLASPRLSQRLWSVPNIWFHIDIYGLFRTELVNALHWVARGDLPGGLQMSDVHTPDMIVMFEALLRTRTLRADEDGFLYRIRPNYGASIAGGAIRSGNGRKDRGYEQYKRVQRALRETVLHAPLGRADKVRALAILQIALRHASFTAEEQHMLRHELATALSDRRYGDAALAGLKYAALSPGALTRGSAWRTLLRGRP